MFTVGIENKSCPVEAHGDVSPSTLFQVWNTPIPRDRAQEVARVIKSSAAVTLEGLPCSLKALVVNSHFISLVGQNSQVEGISV